MDLAALDLAALDLEALDLAALDLAAPSTLAQLQAAAAEPFHGPPDVFIHAAVSTAGDRAALAGADHLAPAALIDEVAGDARAGCGAATTLAWAHRTQAGCCGPSWPETGEPADASCSRRWRRCSADVRACVRGRGRLRPRGPTRRSRPVVPRSPQGRGTWPRYERLRARSPTLLDDSE